MNHPNPLAATGRQLAEDGAKQASDHADRVIQGWSDRAYAHALTFLATHPDGQNFTTEQIRAYAGTKGLAPPPDSRAWGQVALRLKRAGRIEAVGFTHCKSPRSHASPTTLWAATNPVTLIEGVPHV